jgi:hypothetical protein
MSEQKGHINLFSAKDIERYLKGELSPAEMHAIEKAALDDPFLADAIEGMEETMGAYGEGIINTNLESIQQQVQNRVANKNSTRVIAFRWWYAAAAAAVVLIAGSLWLFNSSSNKASKEVVAQSVVKNKAQADSPVANATGTLNLPGEDRKANADSSKISFDQKSIAAANESRHSKKYRKKVSAQNGQYYYHDYKLNKDTSNYLASKDVSNGAKFKADTNAYSVRGSGSLLEKSAANDKQELLKKLPGVEVSSSGSIVARGEKADSIETEMIQLKAKPNAVVSANQDDKARLHNVIKGRVVDQFDNPLSNANVLSLDDRVTLTTDQYGLFRMPSKDTLVHVIVSVSGYTTQNFTLQNNAALNNIQLQPADANLESRSIGSKEGFFESKDLSDGYKATSIVHQDAQPVNGWVNFEQYLIKNKTPPPDNPKVKGQVVVSFTVNRKSGLSDFKVEQHLAQGYDEEAIRLVKEGPQWKLLKGKKAKIMVVVHF